MRWVEEGDIPTEGEAMKDREEITKLTLPNAKIFWRDMYEIQQRTS